MDSLEKNVWGLKLGTFGFLFLFFFVYISTLYVCAFLTLHFLEMK